MDDFAITIAVLVAMFLGLAWTVGHEMRQDARKQQELTGLFVAARRRRPTP